MMKERRSLLRRALAGGMTAAMLLSCGGLTALAAEEDTFTLGI